MRVKFTFLCLFCTLVLNANRRYVSPNGNDTNAGTTLALAYRTLQRAANLVNPGDTVFVSDSTYAGFDIRRSGTSANPIVFIATSLNVIVNRRNAVTIDGINIENADWIKIQGFTVINQPRAGIRAVLSDHITISNNKCLNNQRWGIFTGFTDFFIAEYNECANSNIEHGIYVSNSSDNAIIRYNISHHNNAAGLHFNGDISQGSDGINHSPQVYNNIIYENGNAGGSAINMDGNQDALIYNNLIYNNHATGIALYQIDGGGPSIGARIFHNTIIQPAVSRWAILLVDGATNATIRNNIIINLHSTRGAFNVDAASLQGLSSDYNILSNKFTTNDGSSILDSVAWKSLGLDVHSFFNPSVNNLFTDYTNGNLTLKIGSKAINFGTTISSPTIAFDLNNNNRVSGASPDAGAYEFITNAPLPLHWLHTSISRIKNYTAIKGILADVSSGTKVCLTKWNESSKSFVSIDCRTLSGDQNKSEILFTDYSNTNGIAKYQLIALEIGSSQIKSNILSILVKDELIDFYPNPATTTLKINNLNQNASHQITLTDLAGRILDKSSLIGNEYTLDRVGSGTYIITLISDNKPIMTRLITKL